MPNIQEIKARADNVLGTLKQLSQEMGRECPGSLSARVMTDSSSALAELEQLRQRTEALRRQVQEHKNRSRIDPEVLELERKLDEALAHYYWLWQKCKDNIASEHS